MERALAGHNLLYEFWHKGNVLKPILMGKCCFPQGSYRNRRSSAGSKSTAMTIGAVRWRGPVAGYQLCGERKPRHDWKIYGRWRACRAAA